MGKISEIVNAALWYRRSGHDQYSPEGIARYDSAARALTQREVFAAELMDKIGDEPGLTLEIAAGTGLISQELEKHIPNTVYTDREVAAVRILRQRLLGRAAILQADFFNLPFDDDSFDTVVGVGAYRYVPHERSDEFWDEMHRVIRPQGRAVIAQFYARGVAIRGNDINKDIASSEPHFSLTRVGYWDSTVNLGPLHIKSGTYRTFEFSHNR